MNRKTVISVDVGLGTQLVKSLGVFPKGITGETASHLQQPQAGHGRQDCIGREIQKRATFPNVHIGSSQFLRSSSAVIHAEPAVEVEPCYLQVH
ncbi:hypothetical protein Y1Q_0009473 [Alligator mississippiensis]|uniref:Uncharacterized protein n=1 Tax=Alligator mississippiensis TaxID=8496 RepID=A0A151M7M3_ALLMI|nr:hypothetical protein Y1Q_0009473 [Alligator mississippiensis]